MKTFAVCFLSVLTALILCSVSSNAQTFTSIYSFGTKTNPVNGFNMDGTFPVSVVVGTDGLLYGCANGGGTNGAGTAFKMTTAGTITVLHTFCNSVVCPGSLGSPNGMIQASDGNFYGTALTGGANDGGGIFKLTSQGTFSTLYSFCSDVVSGVCLDGNAPKAGLIEGIDGNFYGTTSGGGSNNEGTVFQISPAGMFSNFFNFPVAFASQPNTGLFQGSDTNFYGIFHGGGNSGDGIVYRLTPDGIYSNIYNFGNSTNNNRDGTGPLAPPIEFGGNLIGTTLSAGGVGNGGTVFVIPIDGTTDGDASKLYSFCTSCDFHGFAPTAQLLIGSDTNFYGTTSEGGQNNGGTVFQLTTEGTLTTLHSFCTVTNPASCTDGALEGAHQEAPLVQGHNGKFYGVTEGGGTKGNGTVFEIDMGLPGTGPVCTFALSATNATPGAAGGSATVGVIASNGCDWTAVSNDGFITITSGSSGSGNGTVHYSVDANSSTNPVTGTMTIADQTFTVTQAGAAASGGCTFTVSPTVITLTSKGGSKSVSVKASGSVCDWTAISNDPFITITSGSNGTASGKVAFTVPGNTNETALSGTMTIAGQTVTVNQAIGGCSFKLSPKSAKFKNTGGVKTVKVTPNLADCTWTAFSNSGFVTITGGASGVGKGVVSYTVSTNATTNTLSGTMTVAGQTYTVTEAGAK